MGTVDNHLFGAGYDDIGWGLLYRAGPKAWKCMEEWQTQTTGIRLCRADQDARCSTPNSCGGTDAQKRKQRLALQQHAAVVGGGGGWWWWVHKYVVGGGGWWWRVCVRTHAALTLSLPTGAPHTAGCLPRMLDGWKRERDSCRTQNK